MYVRLTYLCGLLFLLLVAPACDREPARRPATKVKRPGIVVFVLDTLRADALVLGDARPTQMPSLRTFAATATVFADAFAPAAWTPQSMPTLLTGLTPPHTGCQGTPEMGIPPLPEAVFTLGERLKKVGYQTAAYTGGGFVSRGNGVAQGFDVFLPEFDTVGPESCIAAWSQARTPDAPFFLLLHTYAPHDPYGAKPPRGALSAAQISAQASPTIRRVQGAGRGAAEVASALEDRGTLRDCAFEWYFDSPARPANLALIARGDPQMTLDRAIREWIDGGYLDDVQGRTVIEDRFRTEYQRGLVATDDVVARTLATLDAAKLPPDTIVIVTSDHGEAHGEHGYLTHGRHLHREIVHVPLMIRAPDRMPPGVVVEGMCGLVDLAPTLLALAGLPTFEGELDGRSLLPLAHGRASGHPVLSSADRPETDGRRVRQVRELTVRDERRVWSHAYDLATGQVVREYIFDLVLDPQERERRPVESAAWDDDAFCRLVAECRSLGKDRAGPAPASPPCSSVR